ncbi:MAG: M48 family metallopeptidase [Blastocatellia bacterium]|nr:M48 family metallopeptidase [Blastocatellia bacterium]
MQKNRPVTSLLIAALLLTTFGCNRAGNGDAPPGSRSEPRYKPGFNLFSPQQDIQMGQQSAQQIMQETPMLKDPQIDGYIRQLGAKLAAKAAGEPFPYQFRVVATKEINAFALPGGFLFVNAGAIAAARNEGELAGVMAHEIAHAALRHGTAQATKQQIAQMGLGILGSIASSGENPDLGRAVGTIGGLGANMLFLKFGRGAEKQADLEGARILAEAGYDPRDMANFFKTLQAEGGDRVPEMLSDHPDPGNRIKYILDEIPRLPVAGNPVRTTPEFEAVKGRLTGNAPQMSAASQLKRIGPSDPGDLELGNRPPRPLAQFKGYQARDRSFAVQVPGNWEVVTAGDSEIILAPRGGSGNLDGQLMVTHGIFIGARPATQGDLRSATQAFIEQQLESNPDFQVERAPQQIDFGGQEGYVSIVSGPSAINGVIEVDITYTTVTADGRMFYIITIAPEDEAEIYKPAFEKIIRSLQLAR